MTHPFHPLFGHELDLVDRRIRGTAGDRVYFYDEHGRLQSLPVAWTDLAAEDPFVAASAGRAYFRIVDLLRLSELIDSWSKPPAREERSVK